MTHEKTSYDIAAEMYAEMADIREEVYEETEALKPLLNRIAKLYKDNDWLMDGYQYLVTNEPDMWTFSISDHQSYTIQAPQDDMIHWVHGTIIYCVQEILKGFAWSWVNEYDGALTTVVIYALGEDNTIMRCESRSQLNSGAFLIAFRKAMEFYIKSFN